MKKGRVALLIRIPSELKERLTMLAASENRSLNRQIEYLLRQSTLDARGEPRNKATRRPTKVDQPGK